MFLRASSSSSTTIWRWNVSRQTYYSKRLCITPVHLVAISDTTIVTLRYMSDYVVTVSIRVNDGSSMSLAPTDIFALQVKQDVESYVCITTSSLNTTNVATTHILDSVTVLKSSQCRGYVLVSIPALMVLRKRKLETNYYLGPVASWP